MLIKDGELLPPCELCPWCLELGERGGAVLGVKTQGQLCVYKRKQKSN